MKNNKWLIWCSLCWMLVITGCVRNQFDLQRYDEIVDEMSPVENVDENHDWQLSTTKTLMVDISGLEDIEHVQILTENPAVTDLAAIVGESYVSSKTVFPVSITYEYDPNDLAKARELNEKELTGEYRKDEFEDIDTITRGIRGYKGHVKLVAGDPITGGFEITFSIFLRKVTFYRHNTIRKFILMTVYGFHDKITVYFNSITRICHFKITGTWLINRFAILRNFFLYKVVSCYS